MRLVAIDMSLLTRFAAMIKLVDLLIALLCITLFYEIYQVCHLASFIYVRRQII